MAETQTLSDLKDLGQAADAVTEAPIREQELDQHGRAYGTGRRHDAIARVWINPGTGPIVVNTRDPGVPFPPPVPRMPLHQPFRVAAWANPSHRYATLTGGGLSVPARSARTGTRPA